MKNKKSVNEPKNDENAADTNGTASGTKIYFYIAIACTAVAAISFGLSFSVLGIYALIASIISELCALSFAATQKKKNPFPALKFVFIATYALLALSAALFIGGLIYSASV